MKKLNFAKLVLGGLLCTVSSGCMEDENFLELEQPRTLATRSSTQDGEPGYITINYPTALSLKFNTAIYQDMELLWQLTKSSAYGGLRRELGFYIYYNYKTNKVYRGLTVYGPLVHNDETANIDLGEPVNKDEVCASFHTHTPYTYMPAGSSRLTGRSLRDFLTATISGIPGIVYDYICDTLRAGHPIDYPAFVSTYGPERRSSRTISVN